MARKKKVEKKDLIMDIAKLPITKKDKYADQVKAYLKDKISDSKISKDGNTINMTVPTTISKRVLKLRLNKVLYNASLTDEFRIIAYSSEKGDGYQIMNK